MWAVRLITYCWPLYYSQPLEQLWLLQYIKKLHIQVVCSMIGQSQDNTKSLQKCSSNPNVCLQLHKTMIILTDRDCWCMASHLSTQPHATHCKHPIHSLWWYIRVCTSSLDTIMNSITITCHKTDWYNVYPVLIPSELISCTFSDWLVKMTNPDWLPSNLSDWNNTSCVWWWYSMASSGSLSSGGFLRNFVL